MTILNQVFLISTILHMYLLSLSFQIPNSSDKFFLVFQEIGLIIDNLTLYLGLFLKPSFFLKFMNQLRFFLHMVVAPTLFFPIGNLYDNYSSYVKFIIFVVSVFFSIEGFFEFLRISFVVTEEHNLIRYSRKPKASFKDIIPVISLNISTLILGSIIWYQKGDYILFITSFIMFLSAGSSEKFRFHLSNLGEVFFTFGLIHVLLKKKI